MTKKSMLENEKESLKFCINRIEKLEQQEETFDNQVKLDVLKDKSLVHFKKIGRLEKELAEDIEKSISQTTNFKTI